MKYTIKYETVNEMAGNISIVANKDAAVVLSFGFKELGEKVANALRITTIHEELSMQFACDKPVGYDGKPSKIIVKASLLSTVLASLMSQKGDVFFDITETGLVIGVEGKAQVPVPVMAEATSAMTGGTPMLCLSLSGKDFMEFLRKGLMCASDGNDNNRPGLTNAVMIINSETGEMQGASTDQYRMGYAVMKGVVSPNKTNPEKEQEALKAYCEKTGTSPAEVPVILPKQIVEHIKTLVGNNDAFRMILDEHTVSLVLGGNKALYKAVQGATQPLAMGIMKQTVDTETEVKASLDCEELEKAVSFMNAMNDATSSNGKVFPIRFGVKNGSLIAEGSKSELLRSAVKVDSKGEDDVFVTVNGKFVKSILSLLKKGGVVIGLTNSRMPLVTFANGTIAKGEDGTGKLVLVGTSDSAIESEETETDEAEAESQE